MEKLINIKNYEDFKDSLNEELLWAAIKNLFSKVFGNIDKKLADSISNFTKRLDGSKSWDESLKIYEEFTKKDLAETTVSLKTVTGPLGLRKVLYDNSCRIFLELQEMSNKYQTPELQGKKIFLGQPEQKMFEFDNSEDFAEAAMEACNSKILELNGDAYSDKPALEKYLKDNTDIKTVQTAAAPAPTAPAPTAPAPTAPVVPTGNIETLKASALAWLTNNLYGHSLTKVKSIKPAIATALAGSKDPFTSISTGSKATANKENLAKLLRNIVNIPDTATLAKVRDAVATAQRKDPADFTKEIGKF